MKQKVIRPLIMMTLLTASLTVGAAGQSRLTVGQVKARAAIAQTKGKEVAVKLTPGTRILIGAKELSFEFIKGGSLSGIVKEMRENDFTLASKSPRTGEVTAVISYTDVLSINRPSGFAKALKAIGKYSLMGPAAVGFLPVYAILALMGDLPSC